MKSLVPLLALGLLSACAGRPAPVPTLGPSGAVTRTPDDVPGYQHGADRTRFVVGNRPRWRFANGHVSWQGDNGTFAINPVSGAAVGTPARARLAAAETRGGTPLDAARHSSLVRRYFTEIGVPDEQIGSIDDLTLLAEHGEVSSPIQPAPVVIGYVTALRREVDGIPVPDSVAWARLDSQGAVLAEGVHWPPIPRSAIDEARRLQNIAADPARLRAVMTDLPTDASPGMVVIRHTTAASYEQPIAVAAYVVTAEPQVSHGRETRRTASPDLYFDSSGKRVVLPSERETPVEETPRR
ncbi:MAG: hypothetical protein KF823_01015 [Xanthomonadales bacterium]|nr:hypothetical protein [Xanthomonadales bacterium]